MRCQPLLTLALGALAVRASAPPQVRLMDEKPSLTDLLTVERSVSAFSSYLRESKTLYGRLLNPLTGKTTLFAPRDAAIMALHRKPHEGPVEDGKLEISVVDAEKRNAAYLEAWVSSHIVPDAVDLDELPKGEVETLAEDRTLRFEADQPRRGEPWQSVTIQPGNARIVAAREAKDGTLYILDSCLE